MALLFASQFATGDHRSPTACCSRPPACLGIGFGFAVPALNTFTAAFFPAKVDQAILTLNALLGLGTALAPIFAMIFVGLGILVGPAAADGRADAGADSFQPAPAAEGWRAPTGRCHAPHRRRRRIPARFWLYAAFALLYGICETMNGNWATVYHVHESRRFDHAGLHGADGLLGHGHRRPRALRRHREMVSAALDLSRPARRCWRSRFVATACGAEGRIRPRDSLLRPGRTGLLRPAAAGHQLRPGGTDHHDARPSRAA